jgi:hypothetical protein
VRMKIHIIGQNCIQRREFELYWFHYRTVSCCCYNSIVIEKLIAAQLVKKFTEFYGIRRFITVFTRAHHRSLS